MSIALRSRIAIALAIPLSLTACSDSALAPTRMGSGDAANFSAATISSANLIVNGSFEDPVVGAASGGTYYGWATFCPGDASITGWTIGGTDCVDVHWGEFGTPWSNIPNGVQALDLNGSGIGATMTQAVHGTLAGRKYTLSFDVSDNTACAPPVVQAALRFGGTPVDVVTRVSGGNLRNMTWDHHAYTIAAPTDNAELQFEALTYTGCGFVLDNIRMADSEGLLIEAIRAAAKNTGVANSLIVKLGQKDLNSFTSELKAQTGKGVSAVDAANILAMAQALLG